jgi:hypothetical protein
MCLILAELVGKGGSWTYATLDEVAACLPAALSLRPEALRHHLRRLDRHNWALWNSRSGAGTKELSITADGLQFLNTHSGGGPFECQVVSAQNGRRVPSRQQIQILNWFAARGGRVSTPAPKLAEEFSQHTVSVRKTLQAMRRDGWLDSQGSTMNTEYFLTDAGYGWVEEGYREVTKLPAPQALSQSRPRSAQTLKNLRKQAILEVFASRGGVWPKPTGQAIHNALPAELQGEFDINVYLKEMADDNLLIITKASLRHYEKIELAEAGQAPYNSAAGESDQINFAAEQDFSDDPEVALEILQAIDSALGAKDQLRAELLLEKLESMPGQIWTGPDAMDIAQIYPVDLRVTHSAVSQLLKWLERLEVVEQFVHGRRRQWLKTTPVGRAWRTYRLERKTAEQTVLDTGEAPKTIPLSASIIPEGEACLHMADGFDLPEDATVWRSIITGVSGSGKTSTVSVKIEETHKLGWPIVVVDVKGDLYGLRSSMDGQSAGLPLPIFGGLHGDKDLPDPRALARLATQSRKSFILDVSELDEDEMSEYLADFLDEFYRSQGRLPIHLVLEEAHQIAPSTKYHKRLLKACMRIAKMGRGRGIGQTWATQRVRDLHIGIRSQMECAIILKQDDPHDISVVTEWIGKHGDADLAAAAIASLRKLKPGECWFHASEYFSDLMHVRIRRRDTYDSSASPKPSQPYVEPDVRAEIPQAFWDEFPELDVPWEFMGIEEETRGESGGRRRGGGADVSNLVKELTKAFAGVSKPEDVSELTELKAELARISAELDTERQVHGRSVTALEAEVRRLQASVTESEMELLRAKATLDAHGIDLPAPRHGGLEVVLPTG